MLNGKRVAILATDGYEQSELTVPLEALRETEAEVQIVSLGKQPIRGVKGHEWADEVDVDATVDEVSADDFDALVIPGGLYNPDSLRANEDAVSFVRAMNKAAKPIAAICHGGWLLIEAGLTRDLKATSYHSIRTDMLNAGADWTDEEVVVDRGIITSRSPDDLEAFCSKLIESLSVPRPGQRMSAVAAG